MAEEKAGTANKPGFNLAGFLTKTVINLILIVLPALLIGGLLFWLASLINWWRLDRTLALVVFVILWVVLSFIVATYASALFIRDKSRGGYLMRLLIMGVGGLVIPLVVFGGANLLNIAPGETYMARLIQVSLVKPVDVSMAQLGTTVTGSKNMFTKIEGIKAINSTHSPAAMEQLFFILNNDPAGVADPLVSDALAKVLASYGTDAKPNLLAAFQKFAKTAPAEPADQPDGLYNRYFAQSIAEMQAEINAQPVDDRTKQDRLLQVSELATRIQSDLKEVQTGAFSSGKGAPALALVLNTCLQMTLTSDGDLYAFAKTSAADAGLPDEVRAKALLLVAKLGGKDDFPLLYSYLTNSSEVIKASAFEAIAGINQNLSGPAKTK